MKSLINARGTARLLTLAIAGCLAIFVVSSASAEIVIIEMTLDEADALNAELDALMADAGGTPDGTTSEGEDICTHLGVHREGERPL